MKISAINGSITQIRNSKTNFTSSQKESYENPIYRGKKCLAICGSIGASALVGITVAGLASYYMKEAFQANKKLFFGISAVTMFMTMALTLPARLHDIQKREHLFTKTT